MSTRKPFAVGDRIRVYFYTSYPNYPTGKIVNILPDGLIRYKQDNLGNGEFIVHSKQCRRIIPKAKAPKQEERIRAWANVYPDGPIFHFSKKLAAINKCPSTARTAELVELREGEFICTKEMFISLFTKTFPPINPDTIYGLSDQLLKAIGLNEK